MALRSSMIQATAISTYYDIVTGASSPGSLLICISMKAETTTVAGKVRLWLYDGSNRRLLDEFLVPVVTSSNTSLGWSAYYRDEQLALVSASWKIQAELTVANTIDFIARVEDL